jgi:hypothetical protein
LSSESDAGRQVGCGMCREVIVFVIEAREVRE